MSYQCLHRCRVCVILLHPVRSGRSYSIFFFQAEDGIRDLTVTGVQTCALPICDAIAAPLTKSLPGDVWPTVVCDEAGRDWERVVEGKRGDLGGGRIIKKKKIHSDSIANSN